MCNDIDESYLADEFRKHNIISMMTTCFCLISILPVYISSWIQVLYDFVMNDNVGPWSRVTRPTKIGHASVSNQQEYEKQMKKAVQQANQEE
jgi:hypothetical protein